MKTLDDLYRLVGRIRYKGWEFYVGHFRGNEVPYLRVRFHATDTETGEPAMQYGRKWPLSLHMTDAEIVQTALKAVLTAEEHEAREAFKVDGKAIFGPHLSLDALLAMADEVERRKAVPA